MPGRSAPPAAESFPRRCSSAFTSVPREWPAPAWTTIPAGLFTITKSSSTYKQIERQIFRQGLQRGPRQNFDLDGFSGRDSVRNLGDVAVHANVAFADQFLDARAAQLRDTLGEK